LNRKGEKRMGRMLIRWERWERKIRRVVVKRDGRGERE
jgi:hypothetical protein